MQRSFKNLNITSDGLICFNFSAVTSTLGTNYCRIVLLVLTNQVCICPVAL